jgi:molecular chaperone GrpE
MKPKEKDKESKNKELNAQELKRKDEDLKKQAKEDKDITSLQLAEELKKKTQEYDALWDRYLRVCADFDNARKRWERERHEITKFANSKLIRELVIILDELEQASKVIKEHNPNPEILKGIQITYNNLLNILKREGLVIIEAKDKKFDPHLHEIVGQRESEDELEHIVLEEVQKGYLLGDRVLRTSKVIIGVKRKVKEVAKNNKISEGEIREEQDNRDT